MNRKEFYDSLKKVVISDDVNKTISSVYKNVPAIILKILSKYPSPELFDENESRTLSLNEVIHAEENNGVPFRSKALIPIADFGDNDYIVYNSDQKKWYMYNILDETLYNKADSFEKLFL